MSILDLDMVQVREEFGDATVDMVREMLGLDGPEDDSTIPVRFVAEKYIRELLTDFASTHWPHTPIQNVGAAMALERIAKMQADYMAECEDEDSVVILPQDDGEALPAAPDSAPPPVLPPSAEVTLATPTRAPAATAPAAAPFAPATSAARAPTHASPLPPAAPSRPVTTPAAAATSAPPPPPRPQVSEDVIKAAYAAHSEAVTLRIEDAVDTYPKATTGQYLNPQYHESLLEQLNPKCPTLIAAGVRPPAKISLVMLGGTGGNPAIAEVVCNFHKKAPGPPYSNGKEGAVAHRFCAKEQGESYPEGCQSIITDYVYKFIHKNMAQLYEESKRLNSAKGAPVSPVDKIRASAIARAKARQNEAATREAIQRQ